MKLFNTLTQSVEILHPLPGSDTIRMYTCGPTVYNYAHVGNLRSFVIADLVKRVARADGLRVRQVMNLTDVDDKTIRDSQAAGRNLREFTAEYTKAFLTDCAALGIERPDAVIAATDAIPDMIDLISRLLERGHAYKSADGSVYFKISSFATYGKLSRKPLGELQAGAGAGENERVSKDEYEKDQAADFALWKAWTPADGPVGWESPFGRGRPGWHIECSAMSMREFGAQFELHTGGVDLIFPHHENEIAQSEAATGTSPFVAHWLHSEHLLADGVKMAKSLHNAPALSEIVARGFDPLDVRFMLLAAHYRSKMNFTDAALVQARESRRRMLETINRLLILAGTQSAPAAAIPAPILAALTEDLDTPRALALTFEWIQQINTEIDAQKLSSMDTARALSELRAITTLLGIDQATSVDDVPEEIIALVHEREQARATKNFVRADEIRKEIEAQGFAITDKPEGIALFKQQKFLRLVSRHT